MAKKKSRSRKKSKFAKVFWLVLAAVFGGGAGGFFNPDWPIVGSLMTGLRSQISTFNSSEGTVVEKLTNALKPSGPVGQAGQDQAAIPMGGAGGAASTQLASAKRPADKLLIATYNIQVFGTSKLAKPEAMSVIIQVIRQFDLVAIQELRSKDDSIMPQLVAALNADGSSYDYIVGPRLGRSASKEQYVYVYDTNRVEHDPNSVFTIVDQEDLLHREPLMVRFRARTQAPDRAFTFWMANIHTDPDDVPEEVAALASVFQVMQKARADEDDVILLGDLNASEKQMGPLGQIPGIRWVVTGTTTNTRRNKAYDNIVFHGQATSEYTGRWGVLDVESAFQLTREKALRISDHNPVWAEFSIWESTPQGTVAARPIVPVR